MLVPQLQRPFCARAFGLLDALWSEAGTLVSAPADAEAKGPYRCLKRLKAPLPLPFPWDFSSLILPDNLSRTQDTTCYSHRLLQRGSCLPKRNLTRKACFRNVTPEKKGPPVAAYSSFLSSHGSFSTRQGHKLLEQILRRCVTDT